jgi:hypothetical protein
MAQQARGFGCIFRHEGCHRHGLLFERERLAAALDDAPRDSREHVHRRTPLFSTGVMKPTRMGHSPRELLEAQERRAALAPIKPT